MPPKLVGPYRILETLGSGGVGTVYRALDRRNDTTVALKLLSTGPALDPKAARRMAREFETLSELSHPNIVKVFDTGVHQGYPYLAMELVEGLTLRHYLNLSGTRLSREDFDSAVRAQRRSTSQSRELYSLSDPGSAPRPFGLSELAAENPSEEFHFESGPQSVRALALAADEPDTEQSFSRENLLPFEPLKGPSGPEPVVPSVNLSELNRTERMGRLKDAMLQLCQALAYIHGQGLIHRDLKPSNIMVDEDRQVRLMDFGLAKFLADDSAVTANGRMVGTFRYMSPEQMQGELLDARADLYSLGVLLYEMLAGRPPFDARSPQELWHKVLETEPPALKFLNPQVDGAMARIAHKLLRKNADERCQTAEEVYEALNE